NDFGTAANTVCGSPHDQFWQVDFGRDLEISKIVMTIGSDDASNRINGASISLDEQNLVSNLQIDSFTDYRIEVDLNEAAKGTVLRVVRPGDSGACRVLQIAEIEVYGGLCGM
ncbi:MAG: discoidin domain-containing protein, partial [SAR324 cluster bacterium]|nr:discoidin domain-containing protein [SAR324 cluster bacterium]